MDDKNYATYSHPILGIKKIRLDGRRADLWDGRGGWRYVRPVR